MGRRLYSLSLKDVTWLEDVLLICLIFHTFVCKFGWVDRDGLDAVPGKNLQTNVWKIYKKYSLVTYSKGTSFKLGKYNLLPSLTFKLAPKTLIRPIGPREM